MFDFSASFRTWALATDPRVWLLILVLGVATLGRSGVLRSEWFDLLKPWRTRKPGQATKNKAPAEGRTHPLRDPLFLFLLVVSSSAVIAWIVMSMIVTARHAR
jgi:hypothetical protein